MVGWVLFRAPSLSVAAGYLKAMAGFGGVSPYTLGWYYNGKILLVTVIGVLAAVPWRECFPRLWARQKFNNLLRGTEYVALALMLVLCAVLTMTSTYTSFIYFQF